MDRFPDNNKNATTLTKGPEFSEKTEAKGKIPRPKMVHIDLGVAVLREDEKKPVKWIPETDQIEVVQTSKTQVRVARFVIGTKSEPGPSYHKCRKEERKPRGGFRPIGVNPGPTLIKERGLMFTQFHWPGRRATESPVSGLSSLRLANRGAKKAGGPFLTCSPRIRVLLQLTLVLSNLYRSLLFRRSGPC